MINKNIFKIINIPIIIFFLINLISLGFFSADAVAETPTNPIPDSPILGRLQTVAGEAQYNLSETDSAKVAGRFIAIFLSLLGVIFIILAIYGGYLWMTARGNAEKVEEAKKILTEAIIGIVIIVAAYVISYFVVTSITTGYFQEGQL